MLSEQKITHAMPAHSVELSVEENAPVTRATPVDVITGALLAPTVAAWCAAGEQWLLLAGVLVAAALGYEDDRRKEHAEPLDPGGLDWRVKALGLLGAAALVATELFDPAAAPWPWAAVFGLTFVLTNAVNFLDNTDGVAAGLAASMLLTLGFGGGATGSTQALALAAGFAALGFLPFNWPYPRLFLGDGGAYALGLCVSYTGLQAASAELRWLLAVAVPLIDFTQVVLMRLVIGVPPWVGDRRHLTHIAQNLPGQATFGLYDYHLPEAPVVSNPFAVVDGTVAVPDDCAPGLGAEVDHAPPVRGEATLVVDGPEGGEDASGRTLEEVEVAEASSEPSAGMTP